MAKKDKKNNDKHSSDYKPKEQDTSNYIPNSTTEVVTSGLNEQRKIRPIPKKSIG